MPQLPTIEDSTYPAKSRPRRRYFRASLPALVERRGCCGGARQHGVTTATCTSTPQTFTELAAASRRTGIFVVVLPHLRCLHSCILYSFDFESSPSVRAGRLRRLRAHSRSSGASVCRAGGHGGPSTRSSACSGGSSGGTVSARTRATRPQSARACPCLLSPLSLPATHPLPAGAGRFG